LVQLPTARQKTSTIFRRAGLGLHFNPSNPPSSRNV
jgi:hypothetical protein